MTSSPDEQPDRRPDRRPEQRPVVRPDVRLEEAPMQAVTCAACDAEVLARKSTWDQTTVQWSAEALVRCVERRTPRADSDRPNRNAFTGCLALRDSLRAAAVRGRLGVQDDEPNGSGSEIER